MDVGLTEALAAVGALVVAGLVAHGVWSARRAGPKIAQPAPAADAGARAEPVMDAAAIADPDDEPPADGAGPPGRPIRHRIPLRLDALIDSIATLRLEGPAAGALLTAHLPATRRAGAKSFSIEGLNAETGQWEVPTGAGRYGELQAGIQLANRSGALNEIEFSEFVQKVQAFADAVGALADFPDMLEAVAAGRELDQFAEAHDAQLAVRLQARTIAWSVGYVQQHAARHGFVPGVVPGRLVMPNDEEGAPPVLTLSFDSKAALADDPNLAALRDLTLAFDVPQTAASVEPFARWQTSAHALAEALEARLVDDLGRPLTPESFEAIGADLGRLYAALDARELSAGSMAARRLFG